MKFQKSLLAFFVMYLLGMILGPILDGMHVHSGVLAYYEPDQLQAWWVPFLFGGATASISLLVVLVEKFFKQSSFQVTWKSALVALFVFIAVYAFSAYSRMPSWAIFLIIAIVARRLGSYFIKNKAAIVIAVVVTLIGPIVEMSLIKAQLFYYIRPDAVGIPFWLYPLYFCAAIAVSALFKSLVQSKWISSEVQTGP